ARAAGPPPETVLPPVPRNGPAATLVPDTSRVQAKVTLAETLGLTRSHPDYYALQLGNRVLGGSFYATRLYRDLREQAGLVYFVDSTFDVGKTRALYAVEYACDPPNVSRARAIVERNLRDMQRAAVGPDELRRAKALALKQIPLSESGAAAIAERLVFLAVRDLPLGEPVLAAHRSLALAAEQGRAAVARWVAGGDAHAGWKIGLTARAMQIQQGVHEPVFGFLLASGARPSGAVFDWAELVRPGFENELCLTVGTTLRGPGVTLAQARA